MQNVVFNNMLITIASLVNINGFHWRINDCCSLGQNKQTRSQSSGFSREMFETGSLRGLLVPQTHKVTYKLCSVTDFLLPRTS